MPGKLIIGVVGTGDESALGAETLEKARLAGELIAKSGALLLTGGGGGIMTAAATGARQAQGHIINVKPGVGRSKYELAERSCTIYTGLSDGRNYINAKVSHALIAMRGGGGTLSEIGLALKLKRPVVALDFWEFLCAEFKLEFFTDATQAVRKALALAGRLDEAIQRNLNYPSFPSQESQLELLSAFIAATEEG